MKTVLFFSLLLMGSLFSSISAQTSINCSSLNGRMECVNDPYSSMTLLQGGQGYLNLNYNDTYGRPLEPWSGRQVEIKWSCDGNYVNFSFEYQGKTYSGRFAITSKVDPDFGVQMNYLEYRKGSSYWKFLVKSR